MWRVDGACVEGGGCMYGGDVWRVGGACVEGGCVESECCACIHHTSLLLL